MAQFSDDAYNTKCLVLVKSCGRAMGKDVKGLQDLPDEFSRFLHGLLSLGTKVAARSRGSTPSSVVTVDTDKPSTQESYTHVLCASHASQAGTLIGNWFEANQSSAAAAVHLVPS